MNILDENIINSQGLLLKSWRIRFRQIGVDIAQSGIQDENIIPFLRQLRRPTFFTRDAGFYNRHLCHRGYCLVHLAVEKSEAAVFIRRFLRHSEFDTQAKRIGSVIRISRRGLWIWRLRVNQEQILLWDR